MKVPFIKAHGAANDFLLTYATEVPAGFPAGEYPALARALCARHTGIGADGWYLVETPWEEADARIRLWNSDGSPAELSGNGTRCAAALLVADGHAGSTVRILTGAGLKTLWLKERAARGFRFEMEVGVPRVEPGGLRFLLSLESGPCEVTVLDVGNPQCAVMVSSLDFDWKDLGARIEAHSHFPRRTNVSVVRKVSDHEIEARFYERGAGPTLSSGTGSVGAAGAAILLGEVRSPVRVRTEGAALDVRWDGPDSPAYLSGPAVIIAKGVFEFYEC